MLFVVGGAAAWALWRRHNKNPTLLKWHAQQHTLPSTGEVVVTRSAEPHEHELVLSFVRQLAEADGGLDQIQCAAEVLRDGFHRGDFSVIFVERAAAGYGVVGMALIQDSFRTFSGPSLYLQDLVINERHRGTGIGTLLMQTLAAVAISRGCDRVFWESHAGNASANTFYAKTIGGENVRGDEQLLTWKLVGRPKLEEAARRAGL